MSLFRQVSGEHSELCSICQNREEPVGPGAPVQDIRLTCGCAFHFGCIVGWTKSSLGDKSAVEKAGGIPCPNSQESIGTCRYEDAEGRKYRLKHEDVDTIVSYAAAHVELAEDAALSHLDAAKLREWLVPEIAGNHSSPSPLICAFIEATTKECPNPKCKNRQSHPHGHACHMVTDGCAVCKTEYCYKCLSTKEDNITLRGGDSNCLCGYWHNFCADLSSSTDVEKYLKLDPYPYDTRCGCQICNECRRDQPCGTCHGNCVVCLGEINPGPLELGVAWVARPEDWVYVEPSSSEDEYEDEYEEGFDLVDAVRHNREEQVVAILTDPDPPDADSLGQALIVASEAAREGIARALVDADANVNTVTNDYRRATSLHCIYQ